MKAERATWFARLSVRAKVPVPLLKQMTQRELVALIDTHDELDELRERERRKAELAAKRRR